MRFTALPTAWVSGFDKTATLRIGETPEAIELRVSGENSILGTLAQSVSNSLTDVLRWAHCWNSTEAMPDDVSNEDVVIELNTDFSTKGLSANELTAVVHAWQAGALSRDSMLDIFRRGEVLPEGRTNEEEVRLIAIGKPAGPNVQFALPWAPDKVKQAP